MKRFAFPLPVWYGTIPIVCDGMEIVMQNYTGEEAAILCGFIGRYVDHDSTCETVRSAYSRLCQGLEQHILTHQDYLWTEQVLQFLMPQWWTEREDHRALAALLLKTQSLIRATR